MRRSQLAAMIISALLQPALSVVSNAECGCGCSERQCTRCNDEGILDALDQLAIQIQPKLKKGVELSALSLSKSNDCDDSNCDTSMEPGCGVDVGCGVEANCGVEASCGIEADCGVEAYSSLPMDHTHSAPSPMPARQRMSTDGIAPLHSAPQPPSHSPVGPEHDSAVDPFQDEAAAVPRPVPAKTISHGPSVREDYKSSFDPQANNRYHRKLSDSPIQTASAEIVSSESSQTSPTQEPEVSSRRVRRSITEPIVTPNRFTVPNPSLPVNSQPKSKTASPAVIRASALQELSSGNASNPSYNSIESANPLR